MFHRTVHLRVNDELGRATPVRLRVTGPAGEAFAPLGRSPEFPVGSGEAVGAAVRLPGGGRWFVIDGACEIALPTGVPLVIEAVKGHAYLPLRHEVTLGAGQMSLRLSLTRWSDDARLAVDGRAHFLSPTDAALEAAAEGLQVANLLAGRFFQPSRDGILYPVTPNLMAFTGQATVPVPVNTFNTHPILGRLALLHAHRPIFPLAFGGDEPDDWTLGDWCAQCHRKGGLVVWCDAGDAGQLGEALAQAILGGVDALEVRPPDRPGEPPVLGLWRRMLAAGVRLPLVGSSAKDSNRTPLGAFRTLVDAPPGTHWADAIRAGRTVVTNGPVLSLAVNDIGPGGSLDVPAGATLRVRATVGSAVPFDRLRVQYNGKPVASATPTGDAPFTATIEADIPVGNGGTIDALCVGRATTALTAGLPPLAQTSAVFVTADGRHPTPDPLAVEALLQSLAATREWAETVARFETAAGRATLLRELDTARDRLTRPPAPPSPRSPG